MACFSLNPNPNPRTCRFRRWLDWNEMSKATLVVGLRRETCAFNHLLASVDTGGTQKGPASRPIWLSPDWTAKAVSQERKMAIYYSTPSIFLSFFSKKTKISTLSMGFGGVGAWQKSTTAWLRAAALKKQENGSKLYFAPFNLCFLPGKSAISRVECSLLRDDFPCMVSRKNPAVHPCID